MPVKTPRYSRVAASRAVLKTEGTLAGWSRPFAIFGIWAMFATSKTEDLGRRLGLELATTLDNDNEYYTNLVQGSNVLKSAGSRSTPRS